MRPQLFESYEPNPSVLREEIDALRTLLGDAEHPEELSETQQILPFFRESRHVAAAIGTIYAECHVPNVIKYELPLFGMFRCDLAIGDSNAGAYVLVEFEDAKQNSIFEPAEGRQALRWGSRFEKGYSQLVDWAWKLRGEGNYSENFARMFGTPRPSLMLMLIVGRDCWVGEVDRVRLRDRVQYNPISGFNSNVWTYDDLLRFLGNRALAATAD